MALRHCIAALILAICQAEACAQGSRTISLPDAQRWQQLQQQVEQSLATGDFGTAEKIGRDAVAAAFAGFGAGDPNVAASLSALGAAQLRPGTVPVYRAR